MNHPVEIERIAALCTQFRKYADTIERLIAVKNRNVTETIADIVGIVGETKRQLGDLGRIAEIPGMDADLVATVLNLRNRYEQLEGGLKELRNDIAGNRRRIISRTKPLQPLPGDDDR